MKTLFGFAMFLAIAILFAACGGEPESGATDSGILFSDAGNVIPSSVTCKIPSASESFISPYLSTMGSSPYFVTNGPVTCSSSFSSAPYNAFSCSDYASDRVKIQQFIQNSEMLSSCCVTVRRPRLSTGLVDESGMVDTWGVTCLPYSTMPDHVLCSAAGEFLGWACLAPSY